MQNNNFIIAICGSPGSGKSTLAELLARAFTDGNEFIPGTNPVVRIDIDQYQSFTDQAIEDIEQWMEGEADYNTFTIPQLDNDLADLKRGKTLQISGQKKPSTAAGPIIFETHFGREHRATGQHIDFMIWLETPLDIALARNIQAFCQDFLAGEEGHHRQQIQWMMEYLTNYQQSVRATLAQQAQRLSSAADVILDGQQNVDALTKQALAAFAKYQDSMAEQS